jgi:hypothetical protein
MKVVAIIIATEIVIETEIATATATAQLIDLRVIVLRVLNLKVADLKPITKAMRATELTAKVVKATLESPSQATLKVAERLTSQQTQSHLMATIRSNIKYVT